MQFVFPSSFTKQMLILTWSPVTRAGTTQNFYIYDFASAVQSNLRHGLGQHRPGFGLNTRPQASAFSHQSSLPTIIYLLTSPDSGYVPYWSQSPTSVPAGMERPALQRRWTYQIGWWVDICLARSLPLLIKFLQVHWIYQLDTTTP
jgi:hypothetical protein